MIAERIQFTVASNDFIHPSQLGGLKFKSTSDVGVALTHIIRSEWSKGKTTSTLAFDISQFFPSLNHQLLVLILEKSGLDHKVSKFFANYLIQRSTNYQWNGISSPPIQSQRWSWPRISIISYFIFIISVSSSLYYRKKV